MFLVAKSSLFLAFYGFIILLQFQETKCCRRQILLQARLVFDKIFGGSNNEKIKIPDDKELKFEEYLIPEANEGPFKKSNLHQEFLSKTNIFLDYTDEKGCYEEEYSQEYLGKAATTMTGKPCVKWSEFTALMRKQVDINIKRLAEVKRNATLLSSKESFSDAEEYVSTSNQTLHTIYEYGAVDHNFCRDPDFTGKPWCFTSIHRQLLWEPCSIPKCTLCWRMRQRARRFQYIKQLLNITWIPKCTPNGSFDRTQCWNKYCWCSDRYGMIIKGTLTRTEDGIPFCGLSYQTRPIKFSSIRVTKPKSKGNLQPRTKGENFRKVPIPRIRPKRKLNQNIWNILTSRWWLMTSPSFRKSNSSSKSNHTIKTTKLKVLHKRRRVRRKLTLGSKAFEIGETFKAKAKGNRKYTCRFKYTTISVLHCTGDGDKHAKPGENKYQHARGCYVRQEKKVLGWRCTRQLSRNTWHVVTFRRGRSSYNSSVYFGMSFHCTRFRVRQRKSFTTRCRRSGQLVTEMFFKRKGHSTYVCMKSYKNKKVIKEKCVRINTSRQQNKEMFFDENAF
ncbi:unnamed protein product [Clavelina lepadiformis]|uniref:Uncharacterized protein n=2 Tax=Clavelina lepadiformis TaxID=159417 RepID=A0ABP0F0J0_CLALP